MDPGGQGGERERLGEQFAAGIEAAMVNDGAPRIAAGEEDAKIVSSALRFIGHLPAVHAAGQPHIGEQQFGFRMRIEEPQPRRTIRRIDNNIAEFAKHLDSRAADLCFVIDDEDGFP